MPIANQPEDVEINFEEYWSPESIGLILKELEKHDVKDN